MKELAKVIADSTYEGGTRLTTLEVRIPRCLQAELNTHRGMCLAGDTVLTFDLPKGTTESEHRAHHMRIDDFVDKWQNGARRKSLRQKTARDTAWINPEQEYTSNEVADRLGMANASNINKACRDGVLSGYKKHDDRVWYMLGRSVLEWRLSTTDTNPRYNLQNRLRNMRIRQINEDTGDVQWSTVKDAFVSGTKSVYTLSTDTMSVAGSADHRIYTPNGWRTIGELEVGDLVCVQKFGTPEEERRDPTALKKIDGQWTTTWNRRKREEMKAQDPLCRKCRNTTATDIHHIVPVHIDVSLAFVDDNVTFLCEECHADEHTDCSSYTKTKSRLYAGTERVQSIKYRGEEQTYDIEIEGAYPNFVANGIIVHNSKNSASSRAIPTTKFVDFVMTDPYIPSMGIAGRGMQDHGALDTSVEEEATQIWLAARDQMVEAAEKLRELGVHKQTQNRLLEPWLWQTVIITATDWANFLNLRCHKDTQPDFQKTAHAIGAALRDSTPKQLQQNEWHTPYIQPDESGLDLEVKKKVSVGRCARVSYLTHDGVRSLDKDLVLYDRLVSQGHMSPTEHVARPCSTNASGGNLFGWHQHRKDIPQEDNHYGLDEDTYAAMYGVSR